VSDRNLLFGILALQNDFVSRDQLLEAMNAWVLAKHRPLGELLRERGALCEEKYALLDALVNCQLLRHGGDVKKSLLAISSISDARAALASVPDADVQASLAYLTAGGAKQASHDTRPPSMSADEPGVGMRYRVLRPHARGGLGEVFVAEDMELHREVALKEIQLRHADDAYSRGRFVLEAEITGGLEHPGIVPVYGLGTYADGRPFYAMRFIRGDNLKHAIARFHARGRERQRPNQQAPTADAPLAAGFDSLQFRRLLGRFLDVCNAVAYAHSRGVLHRDLKPGNIMLGRFGETLVVDWGLAKLVSNDRGQATGNEKTTFPKEKPLKPYSGSSGVETIAGSAVGTPAYMSPEQAEGKVDQLGPATDVYSLGATLYCLLTSESPIKEGEPGEILERVRHGDIPNPATVRPDVPPALANICQKAMSLHPADRYPTALALAADVEHWLADEPVSAHRESTLFKTRRWTRKHPRSVAGFAAAVLVGIIGLAASLFFVQAEKNRTELARQDAEKSAQDARDREAEVQAVLSFVEGKVFAAARPKDQEGGLGHDVRLAGAVKASLPFVEKSFPEHPLIEARLRMTIGKSYYYLGEFQTAAEQFQAARLLFTKHLGPDHPDALSSMNNLAETYAELGRHPEALKLHEETLEGRKVKLGPDHPDTLRSMSNLANSYDDLSQFENAVKLHKETLTRRRRILGHDHRDTLLSMHNLAVSYSSLGLHTEALELREQTYERQKVTLGLKHPDTLRSMHNLAISYATFNRHAEALKLRQESLDLMKVLFGSDHPVTLASMHGLANSYAALNRHADALRLRKEILDLQKAKVPPGHPAILHAMNNLANSYAALDRHAEAVKLHEETLELRKVKLPPDHPELLRSMHNLAASYIDVGRYAESLALNEQTLERRKLKLGLNHPDTLRSMGAVAECLVNLDRGMEAVAVVDECMKRAEGQVVHPRLIPNVMGFRLRAFQKAKDAAGCRATAEIWDQLKRVDAASLYTAARMRAVIAAVLRSSNKSETGAKDADTEADRAMAWLAQAVAAGYKDTAHMKKDKDLDVLRDRPDFLKLLSELEAKAKESKPKQPEK
jgi:serine/threonine protein kinase